MELSEVLLNVIEEQHPVATLIKKTKSLGNDQQDVKLSYQAFCCAMLAKEAKNNMQKIEYINSYAKYINNALSLNENCYEARLFRVSVEKKLTNVAFEKHIDQDTDFLNRNVSNLKDENLRRITQKVLSL